MPPRPVRNKFIPPPANESGEEVEYQELLSVVRDMLAQERLHVPERIQADPVELPFDLTSLSDKHLQKMYSAFTAYSYRAGYLLMEHEAVSSKCKEAADEMVTAFIAANGDSDETLTKIKAQAEQHPEIQKWRRRQRKNNILADAERKQRDNYDKVCERLSRLGTLRNDEWTRSGESPAAKSPRPMRR